MKILLIYNPFSGNRTFSNHLDAILEKLQAKGHLVTIYRISENCSLQDLLEKGNLEEYQKMLIAGGDGTVHQVINTLVKNDLDIPIGIYPVGTANDFAQNFNLPESIEDITEIFTRENYTYCDLPKINDSYFINVASLGFLTDISQKTDQHIKNNLGILSYYIKGLGELKKSRTVHVKVRGGENRFDGEIYFMLVMNGRSAGGLRKLAPLAMINDGLLDVYIFKKCPMLELVNLGGKILKGEHAHSQHIIYFQATKLTVECEEEITTDLDGEKGVEFPLEIEIKPNRLKINTLYHNEDGFGAVKDISFHDVKTAFDSISNGMVNEIKRPFKELRTEKNSVADLMELVSDLPRHNALNYINKGSLNEEYFAIAESTAHNGYLYVVLSSTGSAAGELIRKVTKKEYSHASLSFDEDLKTIISYNGGENIYAPGLNQEMVEFFNKKEDANFMIYKIKADAEQKCKALDEIRKINQMGSSYNLLGLFVPYSHRENIMFCSQFVYTILKVAGIHYFDKKPEEVKPTDFVELDYKRNLEYHSQVFLKEYIAEAQGVSFTET